MSDEISANPETGAASGPLTVSQAAELLNQSQSQEATGEEQVDEGQTEEVEAQPVEAEQSESTEAEVEETAAEDTEQPEEQPTRRYKVKVNGEEREVTFDELKKGYQLESDYRKKTSEIAEQRKQLEAERQHYANQLKAVIPALQQQVNKYANIDWATLAKDDPAQYVAVRAEAEQHFAQLQMAQAESQQLEHQQVQERTQAHRERLTAEKAKLVEKLPVFADPEKGKVAVSELRTYLKDVGYTDDEIGNLADHRATIIAWEAAQYRKAKKAAVVAQKKAVTVPQVQKPGATTRVDPKRDAVSAAAERVRKTGKVDDLAAYLRATSTT